MKKSGLFLALALVMVILASSCGGGGINPSVKNDYIEGQSGGEAETLNWILVTDATSNSYVSNTIDSLITYDNQMNVQLRCLAKDIEVSPDGLIYTITIRDDLKWSDGSQVTADDYVYTLKNLMFSDWLNYPYKSDWQEQVDGKTVLVTPQVVNNTTFTITRQTVYPEFIYNLYGLTPYPKYIATKYEGNAEAFTQAPEFNNLTYTGNLGPYKFKEWVRNDRFVVERNPDYYLGKDIGAPYFNQYIVKLFSDTQTRQAALEAGDITSTGIEPAEVNRFRSMPNIKVYTVPTPSCALLPYNQRNNGWEGLKDKRVRQALSMTINKQTISQTIYLGFAEPAYSFIPATSPWYTEEGVSKYGVGDLVDPQKAAELLLEAGYAVKGNDGTIKAVNKDGSQVRLVLATTTGSKTVNDTAFSIRKDLSQLGIEVEIKLVPWDTLLTQYMENKVPDSKQQPGDNNGPEAVSQERWDLMLLAFNSNILAPSASNVFFATTGGLNFFSYSNPRMDELFQRVRSKEALDKTVRQQLYAEMSRIVADDQPVDFLIFSKRNLGFQKNVEGIDPGINTGYNFYKWYFGPAD